MNSEQTGLAAVALLALIAAASDWRHRRIPNWLSVSAFLAGLLFRGFSEGGAGLSDAAAGFAVGALPLLLLWLIGGGGGGDVKLMGAVSVWLGYRETVLLLVGSALAVLVVHVCVMAYRSRQLRNSGEIRPQLRIAFAIPVCLSAWALVAADVVQHVVEP